MSHSDEEDILSGSPVGPLQSNSPNSNKKRRIQSQRACDRCRLKKSQSLSLGIPIASLCAYTHSHLLSVFVDTVRCSFAFFVVFPSDVHSATLQAMAPPLAQSAHIVCHLVPIASSRNLPRYALSSTECPLVVEYLVSTDSRSSKTVHGSICLWRTLSLIFTPQVMLIASKRA